MKDIEKRFYYTTTLGLDRTAIIHSRFNILNLSLSVE